MALSPEVKMWLYRFTAGEVAAPSKSERSADIDPVMEHLRVRQAKERADEEELKELLIERATAALQDHKEEMRAAFDMELEVDGKKARTRDAQGRQERAFDSEETSRVTKGAKGKHVAGAQNLMALIVEESDKLSRVQTQRSVFDERTKGVKVVKQPLFTDEEIMNELYTPLVRELVLPENFVPDKYSATQKMINASNDHYLQECREKGKKADSGAVALSKGVINVAQGVAGVVLRAQPGGMSQDDAAKLVTLTNGIGALLTAGVDAVDSAIELRDSGDFSVANFKKVANGIASGIGKVVAQQTNNMNLGLFVTDTMSGAIAAVGIAPRIAKWVKAGGDFPISDVIDDIGSAISSGISSASDRTFSGAVSGGSKGGDLSNDLTP